jgi:hypothetical protein
MGLLNKHGVVPDPMPERQTSAVIPAPAPVLKEAPAPAVRNKTLTPVRNVHGRIESVTGYNMAGEKVTFEFERNGRQSLERIKVK